MKSSFRVVLVSLTTTFKRAGNKCCYPVNVNMVEVFLMTSEAVYFRQDSDPGDSDHLKGSQNYNVIFIKLFVTQPSK